MLGSGLEMAEFGEYPGGEYRLYKWQPNGETACTIDIYFGRLRFNHEVPSPYFDRDNQYTLPITQLLLSKLAIVELNEKDKIDIISILAEHELGDSKGKEILQTRILKKVWCRGWKSWGTARTCLLNIHAVRDYVHGLLPTEELPAMQICEKLDELEGVILKWPKSFSWKVRKLLGPKIAWFNQVQPAKSWTQKSANLAKGS
jgi:hypothetical protein